MKSMGIQKIFEFFCVMVLVLLSVFVTWINLGTTLTLAGSDYGLNYVFTDVWVHMTFNTWDDITSTGKPGVTSAMALPWSTLMGFLGYLGLSDIVISLLVFFSFFLLSGLGTFFLCKNLITFHLKMDDRINICIASFCGALLYISSLYVITLLNTPLFNYQFIIPLFPVFFNLIIVNLKEKVTFGRIFLISVVLILLFTANPAHVLLIGIVTLLYVLFFREAVFRIKWNFWKLITGVALTTILLTAYIWFPVLGYIFTTSGSNPYGDVGDQWSSLLYNSRRGQMTNVLLGMGFPWMDSFEYFHLYEENIFVNLAGFVILSVVIASFFFRRNLRIKVFWGLMLLVFLFLSKGYQPPFPKVFKFMFESVPGFSMFRAVYNKFWLVVNLAYAVLASFAIAEFLWNNRKLKIFMSRAIAGIAFPAVVFFNGFPLFSGQVVDDNFKTQLPIEYFKLRESFKDIKTDAKTLCLPATIRGSGSVLVWDNGYRYIGPHIALYAMASPYIDAAWFIKRKFFRLEERDWLEGTGVENNIEKILKFSAKLGVKFVLVQKDFPDNYTFTGNVRLTMNGQKKAFLLNRSFQGFEERGLAKMILNTSSYSVYEIQNDRFLPHLHIPQKMVMVGS